VVKLDISVAIFLYLFFTVIGVFILWVWLDRRPGLSAFNVERKDIWQCSICSYVYIDMKDVDLSRCPRCRSINKKVTDEKNQNRDMNTDAKDK